MKRKITKIILSAASVAAAFITFGLDAFSIMDFSAGESGLINDKTTPYTVNITADGKNVSVVPVGIGMRGDADENSKVDLYDVLKMAGYVSGNPAEGYTDSLGFMMSDVDANGKVDLYDLIKTARYLVFEGTHEEKWAQVLNQT